MSYADRIEAIARAICVSEGRDPEQITWLLPGKAMQESGSHQVWTEYILRARAADAACLKALEEPTPAMIEAGLATHNEAPDECWEAMHSEIDRGEK